MSFFKRKKRLPHSSSLLTKPDNNRTLGSAIKTGQMGSVDAESSASLDSVIKAPDVDANKVNDSDEGAINEPLVLEIAAMLDGHGTNSKSPPMTPVASRPDPDPSESWLSDDETAAPAPPDFTRRGIHIPSRTSSNTPEANKKRISMQRRLSSDTALLTMNGSPESYRSQARSSSRTTSAVPRGSPSTVHTMRGRSVGTGGLRSSSDSVHSYESTTPSFATQNLPPLQEKGNLEDERLSPLLEDDPKSFDLVSAPSEGERSLFSLETRSEKLFSKEHLEAIFQDTASLLRFTSFLSIARPQSVPILIYYLDALKALRAINYANAVAEALEPISDHPFTENPARPTVNAVLEEKASRAFDLLVQDDLPAFITHIFIQTVSVSISKRVTGSLPPLLREASEGLAEVFCLTDPSRADNPIIFASEEFHRTTQYGVSYAIGRNCRFLQGPKTNRTSVGRFKDAILAGKEHSEVFLNYRRDGSPFMNLLMMAPLLDSRGKLRYFIGAQVDVSGLVKDCTDLDAMQRMLDREEGLDVPEEKDEFQLLSEMYNDSELDTIRRHGGKMHREHLADQDDASSHHRPRVLIQDQSTFDIDRAEKPSPRAEGRLSGPYKHYLLVRPAPSLRILFTSPSLRVPGILQSHLLDRIGGTTRVRASIGTALADGSRGVTAKIRWLPQAVADLDDAYEEGRPRWIHCTPLLGQSGTVGVWMVVLVDEKDSAQPVRRFRQAPPVSSDIGGRMSRQRGESAHSNSRAAANAAGDDLDDTRLYDGTGVWAHVPTGAARHIAVDALRRSSSPLQQQPRSPTYMDGKAVRSASSSIKDFGGGGGGRAPSNYSFGI